MLELAFWDANPQLNEDFRKSLEIFYRRIPLVAFSNSGLRLSRNIDELLNAAAETQGLQWLCVIAIGTLFPGQDKIAAQIEAAIASTKEPFLVMGHLIDKKGLYCGIHEQMFIVNMNVYRELGRPDFGGYESGSRMLHNYSAGASIHDDYTPLSVQPAPGVSERRTWSCGWNFVNASLGAGLAVLNLPEELRLAKVYAYPEDQIHKLNKNLELLYQMEDLDNPSQRKLLGFLFNRRFGFNPKSRGSGVNLADRESIVYLFNTEELVANPEWVSKNAQPLDVYFGPCAGFLDMAALRTHGFHDRTRLIYFDINRKSVQIRERLFAEFDGQPERLIPLLKKFMADEPDRPFHLGDADLEYRRLMEAVGSREKFMEIWNAMRRMPKEFLHLNLISENEKLLAKIQPGERALFTISDIFTGTNELLYGYSGLSEKYSAFASACRNYSNLVVSGRDTEGRPFTDLASRIPLAIHID